MAERLSRVSRARAVAGVRPGDALRATCIATGIGLAVLAAIAASAAPDGGSPTRVALASVARPAGSSSSPSASVPTFRSVRTYRGVAVPVRLRIPRIGVDTGLQRLGRAADGTIAVPTAWGAAGWYAKGPRPGQPGPAVIVGHVDSRSGPAVFFRLAQLRPGDAVLVDRADGGTERFVVSGRHQVAKSAFPADLVYAPTLQTVLRLVTCGGTFDAGTGHYRDNIIVSAVPGR